MSQESAWKRKAELWRTGISLDWNWRSFKFQAFKPVYDELSEAPLTPSHLVIGRRLLDQSPVVTAPMNTLARREKYLNSLLAHFRNRWKREYLTGIREYQKLNWGGLKKSHSSWGHCTHLCRPRDYEVREHIPHTWVSSNDSFFQSNFSAWSYCAAILRKTPDWSVVMT